MPTCESMGARVCILLAVLLAGCGAKKTQLTGDVQFEVAAALTLRTDAGSFQRVRVYLADTDASCADLTAYDAAVDLGQPATPPFRQAVQLLFLGSGPDHRAIQTPFESPSADEAGAGWLFADGGGTAAVNGAIDLSSSDGTSGDFDTFTVAASDYLSLLGGGTLAPDGGALWLDGGPVPVRRVSGSFSALACP